MESRSADLVGRVVGHIRILEVLGRGGMGTVYIGEDEALRRRVAVKAIRGEYRLHKEAKARFLREARILSNMNHRNICVVHDLVETEECDLLVLELVPGTSLRKAMATPLSQRRKLAVARQLLEVLVAVHRNGVIHRDLKPENIMVKPDGDITVLDFGLARSVEEDVAMFGEAPELGAADLVPLSLSVDDAMPSGPLSTLVRTNEGTLVGTAGYMSPEQARGEPVTAASDMYSAGLILQELFTDSPPFDRSLGGLELLIKAAQGQTLPVTGLPADMTTLIERLKSAAPGARPSSVDALAHLRRIIDRPRRRRRRAVVAAVWAALAVLAGGMTVQWARASREARRANSEAVAARQVSDFLVNLFEESNPEQALGTSLSAEEILHRGARRIADELEEQPLIRARLLMTIARVYDKMGLFSDAVSLATEALEIRTRELGEDDAEIGKTLTLLGWYCEKNGDSPQAEAYLGRALSLQRKLADVDPLDRAQTLMNLGSMLSSSGRYREAEPRLRQALTIYEDELGPDQVFTSRCLNNLAVLTARQGRVAEAEPMFRRVLAIQERELGPDHPSVGEATGNLAIALKILGKHDEAEQLYLHNLEAQERVLGKDHPAICQILQNLANLYDQMGRLDEAEPLYLRSVQVALTALGPDHPESARALDNLGALYLEQGRLREAEAKFTEARAIWERVVEPGHPSRGVNMLNLATVSHQLGEDRQAEDLYRRSLAAFRAAFAPGHRRRLEAAEGLAGLLRETGRMDEAAAVEAQEEVPRPEEEVEGT